MYLHNLLIISNPSVLKIFKLVVLLCSYERFSTGKVNTMDFSSSPEVISVVHHCLSPRRPEEEME